MKDMRTVVGLFEDASEAQRAIKDLRSSNIAKDSIRDFTSASSSAKQLDVLNTDIGEPDVHFYQEGIRKGGTLVVVSAPEQDAQRAAAIMARYNMVDVDARSTEYKAAGSNYNLRDLDNGDYVLPIVEEELKVGKRTVERGRMRIYTKMTETPVEEQVQLREEHVNVERRPVDRAVTDADMAAMKEGTIEMTEMAEEVVVSKRARVIEEVVVRKEATDRTETVRDTVRRTDVNVEQLGTQNTQSTQGMVSTSDYASYEGDFRSHYQKSYADSGYSYEEYTPVYRYGHTLATNELYNGREWNDIETDARTNWEQSNPGTWEQFKDSVRYAWDKARGRR